MFERITPEEAGISSARIADFISMLERRGLATHSLLMMKGDKLFAEYYWAPFDQNFCHRMYSQTKSYVAVAIGLLEEDGKLKLTDRVMDYFSDYDREDLDDYTKRLTVYDLLTEAVRQNRLHLDASGSEGMKYVSGLNHLYEQAYGELSGWMFFVNGESASQSCDQYLLKDGDHVSWQYTLAMGQDLE